MVPALTAYLFSLLVCRVSIGLPAIHAVSYGSDNHEVSPEVLMAHNPAGRTCKETYFISDWHLLVITARIIISETD